MSKIAKIRRNNLRTLIVEHGSIASFAAKSGANPTYLSNVLSGKPASMGGRNMGEKVARKIEKAMNYPEGTLDIDSTAQLPTQSGEVDIESLKASIKDIEKMLEISGDDSLDTKAEAIAERYKYGIKCPLEKVVEIIKQARSHTRQDNG